MRLALSLGLLACLVTGGSLAQPRTGGGNAVNRLAVDMLQHAMTGSDNAVCSPYGLGSALALTCAAAEGPTADGLAQALHLPANQVLSTYGALHQSLAELKTTAGLEWAAANRLWSERKFLAPYLHNVQKSLGALPTTLSFADSEKARLSINAWVKNQTHDQVPELLESTDLSPQTELVLTNALYFRGSWATPFDPKRTSPGAFHRLGKPDVQVPYMHQEAFVPWLEGDEETLVELPYSGSRIVMDVVLPTRLPLAEYSTKLRAERLEAMLGGLTESQSVQLALPRFSLRQRLELEPLVRRLSGPLPFSGQADLSRALGPAGRGMALGAVVQAARLDTDETGSRAAAATAVTVMRGGSQAFEADRPFLVLIRDKTTGAILFIGRVADPSS